MKEEPLSAFLSEADARKALALVGAFGLAMSIQVSLSPPRSIWAAVGALTFLIVLVLLGLLTSNARRFLKIIVLGALPGGALLIYANGLLASPLALLGAMVSIDILPRAQRRYVALGYAFMPLLALGSTPEGEAGVLYRLVTAIFLAALMADRVVIALEDKMLELDAANEELVVLGKAKDDFIARVSHEIRTPLNGVFGHLQVIEKNARDPERVSDSARVALRNYRSVIGLLEDILDTNKMNAGKLALHPMPDALDGIVLGVYEEFLPHAAEKAVGLECHISDSVEIGHRLIDGLRLSQILRNLLSNAIKFSDRGNVVLRVEPGDQPDRIVLTVKDDGIGIRADMMDRVFEPFGQVHSSRFAEYRGTGLGLSIAKQLAEQMGGGIRLDSSPGLGTLVTVELELPIVGEEEISPPAQVVSEGAVLHLLLVEDDPMNQEVFKILLEGRPYEIDTAEDGEVGTEKALAGEYDVIFMDIQMPKMDGLEAVRTLRARGFSKPVIACTASVQKADVEGYLAAGFDDVVSKPYLADDLIAQVEMRRTRSGE